MNVNFTKNNKRKETHHRMRLNSQISRNNDNYERVNGGFLYGIRNERGEKILDFITSYD